MNLHLKNASMVGDHKADVPSDCLPCFIESHPLIKFLEIISALVVLLSIIAYILETLPQYSASEDQGANVDNNTVFATIEYFCIAW